MNATYRAGTSGVRFLVPVSDIECAVDFAADAARRAGIMPGPIVLLGHSSGAHRASLDALAGAHFRRDCPYPAVRVDGFIGLAASYDVMQLQTWHVACSALPPAPTLRCGARGARCIG